MLIIFKMGHVDANNTTCFEAFVLSKCHLNQLIWMPNLFSCSISSIKCTMSASLGTWEEKNFFYKEDLWRGLRNFSWKKPQKPFLMKSISRYSENYFQLSSFKHISALWRRWDLASWSPLMENFIYDVTYSIKRKIYQKNNPFWQNSVNRRQHHRMAGCLCLNEVIFKQYTFTSPGTYRHFLNQDWDFGPPIKHFLLTSPNTAPLVTLSLGLSHC